MTTSTPADGRLTSRAFRALEDGFSGELIRPDDPTYSQARTVWNGMIDRYPALIARCATRDDVTACIRLARDTTMPLAVRGGGHSAAGFGVCDSGVVLDLSLMRKVEVDVGAQRAYVGGGATWADVDGATQAHGLAVTGGLVTHTGVGGLTLGGGFGHLMRRCGLSCDNLVAADLVTADGACVTADSESEPDLMWGLRGGGGNFGVVTRFEFALHPVGPTVLAGALVYPLTSGRSTLRAYRDWADGLPDEMTTVVALRCAPPVPFLPQEIHGTPVVMVAVCWTGSLDEGERLLAPLRQTTRPLADRVEPKSYLHHQSIFDASAPHGRMNYKRNGNLAELSDDVIDLLVDRAAATSPHSLTLLFQLGGAIARVDEQATAYSDRGARFNIDINAQWTDPTDPRAREHMQWVRDLHAALQPSLTGRSYVNFLNGDEDGDRVKSAYGSAKYERLAQLKDRYDPGNLFRLNQNIRPARGQASPSGS